MSLFINLIVALVSMGLIGSLINLSLAKPKALKQAESLVLFFSSAAIFVGVGVLGFAPVGGAV